MEIKSDFGKKAAKTARKRVKNKPRVLAHLSLSDSYGEKLITRLKKDGYIRTHYKDGLRGYSLTSRGKKLLLAENHSRFSFYLSGSSDTNRPRSDFPRRLRLQQASIAYAMFLNAGVEIFRDRKPLLFSTGIRAAPCNMALPVFYHSREVKELGADAVKINNSRTMGILLSPECIYAVFCTGGFQKSYFYLDSSFDYFHYIPDDAAGNTMIRLLCSPALLKGLRNLLLSDLQPPCPDYRLEKPSICKQSVPFHQSESRFYNSYSMSF